MQPASHHAMIATALAALRDSAGAGLAVLHPLAAQLWSSKGLAMGGVETVSADLQSAAAELVVELAQSLQHQHARQHGSGEGMLAVMVLAGLLCSSAVKESFLKMPVASGELQQQQQQLASTLLKVMGSLEPQRSNGSVFVLCALATLEGDGAIGHRVFDTDSTSDMACWCCDSVAGCGESAAQATFTSEESNAACRLLEILMGCRPDLTVYLSCNKGVVSSIRKLLIVPDCAQRWRQHPSCLTMLHSLTKSEVLAHSMVTILSEDSDALASLLKMASETNDLGEKARLLLLKLCSSSNYDTTADHTIVDAMFAADARAVYQITLNSLQSDSFSVMRTQHAEDGAMAATARQYEALMAAERAHSTARVDAALAAAAATEAHQEAQALALEAAYRKLTAKAERDAAAAAIAHAAHISDLEKRLQKEQEARREVESAAAKSAATAEVKLEAVRKAASQEVDECYRKLVILTRAYKALESDRQNLSAALDEATQAAKAAKNCQQRLQEDLQASAEDAKKWRDKANAAAVDAKTSKGALAKQQKIASLVASLISSTETHEQADAKSDDALDPSSNSDLERLPLQEVQGLSQQLNQLTPVREAKAHIEEQKAQRSQEQREQKAPERAPADSVSHFIPPGVSPFRGAGLSQSQGSFSFHSHAEETAGWEVKSHQLPDDELSSVRHVELSQGPCCSDDEDVLCNSQDSQEL